MASYETLYGRRCRTPLCWYQGGELVLVGPKLLKQTTEKVQLVRDRLQASQSRQKAYVDRRRMPLKFVAKGSCVLEGDPNHWCGKGYPLKEAFS